MAATGYNFSTFQKVEMNTETEGHDLEEPFDEDFWLRVRFEVADSTTMVLYSENLSLVSFPEIDKTTFKRLCSSL